tara:strand:- start:123 stop:350 length:228 start_codon:yes stop_codon:yes gene_type:complete
MKYATILIISIFLTNCSLNKDSHYWTEDVIKKEKNKKKLSKILKKLDDITNMTAEEYDIYIDDHIKKSKYPDISK